eukprot:3839422-Pleurochrysis_carterae.AAC.2
MAAAEAEWESEEGKIAMAGRREEEDAFGGKEFGAKEGAPSADSAPNDMLIHCLSSSKAFLLEQRRRDTFECGARLRGESSFGLESGYVSLEGW